MPTKEQRSPSVWRALGTAIGVSVLVLWPVTGAGATPTVAGVANARGSAATNSAALAPQLSIAVDDGRSSATRGDTLTYTVTIRNLDTAPVAGLHVTQTMPTGLTFGSADSAGTVEAGSVTWHVDLNAAASATVHTTMSVSATPKELLRLATVACAGVSAAAPPVVCASHSDLLPAGRQAAAAATAAASRRPASSTNYAWYVGTIGVAVVLAGGAVVMVRRRRLEV
jgi:uncharacterized repeat protein (TIGR01451 family)